MSIESKSSSSSSSFSGSSGSSKSKVDPIIQIVKRNKEIEKRAIKQLSTTSILALALLVSLAGNIVLGTRPPPEPRYIIQYNDGTLVPVIPLSRPIANKAAVTQHVAETIAALHAIDFKNYRAQLTEASTFFTRTGWERYMAEFQNSGTLQALESRQMVLQATLNGLPSVTREYDVAGRYAWDVEVPFVVNYTGAGYNQDVQLIARVTVVRVPVSENPRGIAVAGFAATRK